MSLITVDRDQCTTVAFPYLHGFQSEMHSQSGNGNLDFLNENFKFGFRLNKFIILIMNWGKQFQILQLLWVN